jgi:hypothetical protein
MGKKKIYYEDKYNSKINKQNKKSEVMFNITTRETCYIKSVIENQQNLLFSSAWYIATQNEQIKIINILCNLKINKKEKINWALDIANNLFGVACELNQINFVIFVVTNFNDKYYAKIQSNKIIDYTSIRSQKQVTLDTLKNGLDSDWWLKGFNNIYKCVECPICFEEKTNNIKTKCKHVFCKDCIVSHLERQNDCPLCRNFLLQDRRYDNIIYINGREHGMIQERVIPRMSYDIETYSSNAEFPIRAQPMYTGYNW